MSDLGNEGWPNSMKLGEDIDLDELLLNPVLFVFILSSFQFFRGSPLLGPLLGSQSTKKHPYESQLSSTITINVESPQNI